MVLGVELGGFRGVMCSVMMMTVRCVRMMRSEMMVTGFMVTRGFAMMMSGAVMVFGCFVVMLGCLLRHWSSSKVG